MRKSSSIRRFLLAVVGTLTMTNAMAQGVIDMQAPTTLSETYDAWTVQCVNRSEGEQRQRTCQMSQELLQQGTRQRVLLFAINTAADGGATATLILPFGLLLSEGVRIEIAEKEVVRGAYRTCLPAGCVAELGLSDEVIQQLETSEIASVMMTANTGQPVKTDISLKGFAAAYQRLATLVGET